LRATLEKQMAAKYFSEERQKLDNREVGEILVQAD